MVGNRSIMKNAVLDVWIQEGWAGDGPSLQSHLSYLSNQRRVAWNEEYD